jgi:hypothetical protein
MWWVFVQEVSSAAPNFAVPSSGNSESLGACVLSPAPAAARPCCCPPLLLFALAGCLPPLLPAPVAAHPHRCPPLLLPNPTAPPCCCPPGHFLFRGWILPCPGQPCPPLRWHNLQKRTGNSKQFSCQHTSKQCPTQKHPAAGCTLQYQQCMPSSCCLAGVVRSHIQEQSALRAGCCLFNVDVNAGSS